jgi:hypothetical protein
MGNAHFPRSPVLFDFSSHNQPLLPSASFVVAELEIGLQAKFTSFFGPGITADIGELGLHFHDVTGYEVLTFIRSGTTAAMMASPRPIKRRMK